MERIQFSYEFNDNGDMKEVIQTLKNDSIKCSDVCTAFVDFMISAGYSEETIQKYFSE